MRPILIPLLLIAPLVPAPAHAAPATAPASGPVTKLAMPSFGFAAELSDAWQRQIEPTERVIFRANLMRGGTVVSALDVQLVDGSNTSPERYGENIARNKGGKAARAPVDVAGRPTVLVEFAGAPGAVNARRMYLVEREPWIYQVVHLALDEHAGLEDVEALLRTIELAPPEPPHRHVNFRRPSVRLFASNLNIIFPDPLRPSDAKRKDTICALSQDFADGAGGMSLYVEYKTERAGDVQQVVRTFAVRVKEIFKLTEAPAFTRVRSDPDVYLSEPFVDDTQPDFKPHMMMGMVVPDSEHQIVFTFMLGEKDAEEVRAHAEAARAIAQSIVRAAPR